MKTYDFASLRILLVAFGLPLVLSAIVACDKGTETKAPPLGYTPGTYNSALCGNCFSNPQVLLQSVGAATGSETGQFSFDILAPASPMLNPYNVKAPLFYSGPAALQGILSIRAQDSTFCYAPVGDYHLSTTQVGMMSAGVITGLRINAVGPNGNVIGMTVMTSSLYNPEGVSTVDIGDNRLGMTLRLDVNGRSCGVLQTF